MRTILTTALLLALALPAAALGDDPAPSPQQTANQMCQAERTKLGADTFKLTYGTNANKSNAWGKCVSKNAVAAEHAADNAAKTCKAERDSKGADAFAAEYGTNPNGKNAFGKCVSQHARHETEAETQETVSAARACKAELTADRVAFKKKYKNFGACVSGKTK
jgi:hypothetical protein